VHVLFIFEYDNSCRIITVGVNSVLYHIPGHGDGHWSRCGLEISGEGCQIFAKVKIVDNNSNYQQVRR
jgi:hypothetical protein